MPCAQCACKVSVLGPNLAFFFCCKIQILDKMIGVLGATYMLLECVVVGCASNFVCGMRNRRLDVAILPPDCSLASLVFVMWDREGMALMLWVVVSASLSFHTQQRGNIFCKASWLCASSSPFSMTYACFDLNTCDPFLTNKCKFNPIQ